MERLPTVLRDRIGTVRKLNIRSPGFECLFFKVKVADCSIFLWGNVCT